MTAPKRWTRRAFLGALSSLMLVPFVDIPMAGLQLPGGDDGEGRLAERLAALVDPESARVVGHAYLRAHSDRLAPGELLRSLRSRLPPDPLRGSRDRSLFAFEHEVGRAVREDFANGNTVQVNGWVLARTEVEICALICSR